MTGIGSFASHVQRQQCYANFVERPNANVFLLRL